MNHTALGAIFISLMIIVGLFILLAWVNRSEERQKKALVKTNPNIEHTQGLSLADIEKRAEDLYLKEKVPEADRAAFYQGYRYGLSDMIVFHCGQDHQDDLNLY